MSKIVTKILDGAYLVSQLFWSRRFWGPPAETSALDLDGLLSTSVPAPGSGRDGVTSSAAAASDVIFAVRVQLHVGAGCHVV